MIKRMVRTVKEKNLALDSLFLCGYFLIVYTNYLVNVLLGNYFLGITLILFSIGYLKHKGR